MAKLNFGGVEENVVTRDEFPLEHARCAGSRTGLEPTRQWF